MNTRLCMRSTVFAASILSLSACDPAPPPAVPLAPHQLDYAGVWESRSGVRGEGAYRRVFAQFSPDGRMGYRKITVSGSGHTCSAYNAASIQRMGPDEIEAALAFGLSITLRIDEPPGEVDGVWTMTLDGDRLTRIRRQTRPGLEKLDCDEAKEKRDGVAPEGGVLA